MTTTRSYATIDPATGLVATDQLPSGGGSAAVDEDGVSVVAGATVLDLRHGLDVTTPGGTTARVAVDESEFTYGGTGDMTAEAIGSTVAAGASGKPSDAGHRHAMPTGATPSGGYGTAAAGAASTLLRSDAVLAKPTAADVDFSADVTTNNVTSGHHGLAPKLDGNAGHFLAGDGSWATPTGTGGVATDTIWDAAGDLAVGSGADTAAKLVKGSAGAMLAMSNGAVIWNAGTSFPGSPATNDRYWRTDHGLGFHYDGTRWVSDELFFVELSLTSALPFAATTASGLRAPTLRHIGADIWLDRILTTYFINSGGTALGASHKWVGTFSKADTANSLTTLDTITIDSGASSTWRTDDQSVGVLLTSATNPVVATTWTKTGSPGSLIPYQSLGYRIVAT